jgi:CHAT domain-containing protein
MDVSLQSFGDVPTFSVESAHRLYAALLGPVEEAWRNAHSILVVADGPLAGVPFALLVTAPSALGSEGGDQPLFSSYRSVPWLVRRTAISQLPSVASLITLRGLPAAPLARRPFVGFGDPWFSLEQAQWAERSSSEAGVSSAPHHALSFQRQSAPELTGMKSVELAGLPWLPDTADEVRSVAIALGADPAADVFLGRRANEQVLAGLDLASRRVVMFATHGLVPGDLNGLSEPALALTAPEVAGVRGDGLLTMGEILGLKLNADWVVLSACNTAAADGVGAEAVSGLGRAFFYAGTRAVLVSNWPVETTSAQALTTSVFRFQTEDPSLTRAEALRRAMLDLIDGPGLTAGGRSIASYAHPIFWAPFTLVGDGG